MKLITLELRDFRQFRGTQTLHFATGADHPVTVVFGANGTGKTTILNAFTWALYGEFTPDLEHAERPINMRAWDAAEDGEELSTEVQLEFEHEERRYVVRRVARGRKASGTEQDIATSDVTLHYTDEAGNYKRRENPIDALDHILPKRLHTFFFFNGERIERLVQPEAFEEIEQATKTLLGLEVMERAVRHLPKVAQRFESELAKIGSEEQKELGRELDARRTELTTAEEAHADAKRNVAAAETQRDAVAQRLRELDEARLLQEQRDRLDEEARTVQQQLRDSRASVDDLLSDRGYVAFLDGLSGKVSGIVGELRSRGELPAPIKRTFVTDLLEAGECICGTPLVEGQPAYEQVAGYRDRAGIADVEQRWLQLSAETEHVDHDRDYLRRDLERTVGLVADLRTRQSSLEEQLSEVSRKLGDTPSEEIRALEKEHERLKRDERDWLRREGALDEEVATVREALKSAEERLRMAEAKDAEAEKVRQRVAVAHEAEQAFQQVYELLQNEVRKELDGRIKDTFRSISFKPREPELNEDFELRLWETEGANRSPAAKSTGENMILSLSFVGGLASLARDQAASAAQGGGLEALLSGVGGTYPIVMDAAFGNLDEDYREDVARALPQLAPQTVILVSKAQAAGEVMRELRPQIGHAYVISYHTPKEGEDESFEFDGRAYPYKVSTTHADERAELIALDVT